MSGRWRRLFTSEDELDRQQVVADTASRGADHAARCRAGQNVRLVGRVTSVRVPGRNSREGFEALLDDGTDAVRLVFPGVHSKRQVTPERYLQVSGRLERDERGWAMTDPDIEDLGATEED